MIINKLSNFVPIIILNDNSILGLRNYSLCVYNIVDKSIKFICNLPISSQDKWKYSCRITKRLFRLVNIIGIKEDEDIFILIYNSIVYKLILSNKKIEKLYHLDIGKRPLSLVNIKESNQFLDGIYYGDYCGNPTKHEINIYRIDSNGNHHIVYTFENGKINHIHKLLWDEYNNCMWIFSGDFGDAAGIWMAKNNFKEVLPILKGEQSYRSCMACCSQGDVIYATDTPFEHNTLRRLARKNEEWKSIKIDDLQGSIIYGMETDQYLYFSSTVESNGVYKNRLHSLICRRRGDGIIDDYSYLYQYDKLNDELKIVYKNKKDILPFVPFQFGVMLFPTGSWNRNIIPIFNIATTKFDLQTILINLDN